MRHKTLPLLGTPPPQAVPRALPLFKEGVRQSREGVGKEEELEYGFGREGVHAALRVTYRYATAVNV